MTRKGSDLGGRAGEHGNTVSASRAADELARAGEVAARKGLAEAAEAVEAVDLAAEVRRYRRYPAYRDSGVEWLGEVPEHWRLLSLKQTGDLNAGAGFPDHEQGVSDEEIPFFKVGDMAAAGNEVRLSKWQHSVSHATTLRLRAHVFPPDTIVFAKVPAPVEKDQ